MFFPEVRKMTKFDFLTFSNNLFPDNHSQTLSNCLLTTVSSDFNFLSAYIKSVISANKQILNTFESNYVAFKLVL